LTYSEAFDYLISSYTKGKKRTFGDLLKFLKKFGSPQEKIPIIHVAGTNGKGSVCAMLAGVLQKQGYKVGMFTSPDLHKFNERFMINGEPIYDASFAKYMGVVKQVSEELFGSEIVSYFQILTLIAFMYFCDEKVDFLLLETGIGGRLDSTNIITKPVLSIINTVDYDHMEILGDTIEQIAAEDCGIIKKNCPVVLYMQGEMVYNIVKQHADKKFSILYCPKFVDYQMTANDLDGMEFGIQTDLFEYHRLKLRLIGEYQINNTATVLTAVCALRKSGIMISEESVLGGLAETVWPGRMEVLEYKGRTVILEGAHNMQGAKSLVENMGIYANNKNGVKRHVTIIAAVMKDKQFDKMINAVMCAADSAVFTKPAYGARAANPAELFGALSHGCKAGKTIVTERDYKRALKIALKLTPESGIVVCTGSLYLVGDIRAVIKGIGKRH